jgi:alkyl hydroperoxide reductase subunit AhpC
VQLQNAKAKFEQQGIKLAAISYDSQAILMDFAKRHNIEFPLLADPDSKVIRSFDILNTEAKGMNKGMAHPGFFYIDDSGIIREKYFEAKYTNRFTANNVITKLLPELTQEVSQSVEAPHHRLTLSQSDRTVAPGSRLTLIVDVERSRLLSRRQGVQTDSACVAPIWRNRNHTGHLSEFEDPVPAGHQRASARVRRQVPTHAGCHHTGLKNRSWCPSLARVGEHCFDCR